MKKFQVLGMIMLLVSFFALQGVVKAEDGALSKTENSLKGSIKSGVETANVKADDGDEVGEEAVEGTVEKAKEGEIVPAPPVSTMAGSDAGTVKK